MEMDGSSEGLAELYGDILSRCPKVVMATMVDFGRPDCFAVVSHFY